MISRRDVAKSAFALPLMHLWAGSGLARGIFVEDDLGVASGSPTPDGFVIWTRIPNAVLEAASAVVATVRYEVATSPEFRETEIYARAKSRPARRGISRSRFGSKGSPRSPRITTGFTSRRSGRASWVARRPRRPWDPARRT